MHACGQFDTLSRSDHITVIRDNYILLSLVRTVAMVSYDVLCSTWSELSQKSVYRRKGSPVWVRN